MDGQQSTGKDRAGTTRLEAQSKKDCHLRIEPLLGRGLEKGSQKRKAISGTSQAPTEEPHNVDLREKKQKKGIVQVSQHREQEITWGVWEKTPSGWGRLVSDAERVKSTKRGLNNGSARRYLCLVK